MKIRNEFEYFAAIFQSIFNWNNIQLGIQRSTGPNNFYLNDKLRDGVTWSLRPNLPDASPTLPRELDSKCCFLLNLWDVCCCHRSHDTPKTRQSSPHRRDWATTYFTYVLHKFMQLCFVILLLLPFLFTCNTLIQQASGQDVKVPMSNSIIELDIFRARCQQGSETNYEDMRGTKTEKECLNQWQSLLKLDNNKIIRTHSIRKSKSPIYSSNHRLNGYSLIILSQSANNLYSGVAENSKQSLNTDANTVILNAPKSAVIGNGSSIRTKRSYTDNANSSRAREIATKHKADSQKLEVAFEKYKENHHMYNRIINKEKLTKLVMNGLGLKKLPDMKKANISQLEYSSKYLLYLERLRKHNEGKNDMDNVYTSWPPPTTLQILSIVTNSFSEIPQKKVVRQRRAPSVARNQGKTPFRKGHSLATSDKTNILLHFPLTINDEEFHYEKLDEANVRLMMLYNPALAAKVHHRARTEPGNRQKVNSQQKGRKICDKDYTIGPNHSTSRRPKMRNHILNLKVYQLLPMRKRKQLDARRIEFENTNFGSAVNEETRSQWLEFDVTEAVRGWLNKSYENLGIEIQCDKCKRIGARILSDFSTSPHLVDKNDDDDDVNERFHLAPVLNIIGHVGRTHREKGVQHFGSANNHSSNSNSFYHHSNHGNNKQNKKWPNSCYKAHQRCCRHQLDVAFKDIKGFEFIIQPKMFDAGYCRGRCPPRHNPAHHHALLQSLMWQQDHTRVPRPCCAPSKLTELEILHVDEEHSDKLKISTWSDMQVLECACS